MDLIRLDARETKRVKQLLQGLSPHGNPHFVDQVIATISETSVAITLEMLEQINWSDVGFMHVMSVWEPTQFYKLMKSKRSIVIEKIQLFTPPKLVQDIAQQIEVFEEARNSTTDKLKVALNTFNGAKTKYNAKSVFALRIALALIERHSTFDEGSVLEHLLNKDTAKEDQQSQIDPEKALHHSNSNAKPEAEQRQRTPSDSASENEQEEEKEEYEPELIEEGDEGSTSSKPNNSGPDVSTLSEDNIMNRQDEIQYRQAVDWLHSCGRPTSIVTLLKIFVEAAFAKLSAPNYELILEQHMHELQTQIYESRDKWREYVWKNNDQLGMLTFPQRDEYLIEVFTGQYLKPLKGELAPEVMKLFHYLVRLPDQDGDWDEQHNLPHGCGNPQCRKLVYGLEYYCNGTCKSEHRVCENLEKLSASSGSTSTLNHSEATSKKRPNGSQKRTKKSRKKTIRVPSDSEVSPDVLDIRLLFNRKEWKNGVRIANDIEVGAKSARTQKVIKQCSPDQKACQQSVGKH